MFVLGYNDTSILVGHFVSSPREREKRGIRDTRVLQKCVSVNWEYFEGL